MYLDAAKKQEIFGKYGKSNTDTGSPEAQIALFSYRISHLTEHMKLNRKDYSTERALTTKNVISKDIVLSLRNWVCVSNSLLAATNKIPGRFHYTGDGPDFLCSYHYNKILF